MGHSSILTVRQHERDTINLGIEFVVCPEHREQVRFSSMSNATEPHVTRGSAVDVSPGGMGLICEQFVPRRTEGTVRVYGVKPTGVDIDGTPLFDVVFEHRVKVHRVAMVSGELRYALGVGFVEAAFDIDRHVNRLLEMAGIFVEPAGEGEPDA